MSFIENKQNIVTTLGILEVLNQQPKGKVTTSLLSASSKNRNLIPFIIDLIGITCKDNPTSPKDKGRCEATRILAEILIEFFPVLIRILKEGIIRAIKAGLMCGSDFTIPTVSLKMKLSELDFNGLLKINPNDSAGSVFYGRNANVDVNWFLYNLVQNGGTASWQNILKFTFDQTNEEITIEPDTAASNKRFEDFLIQYLNSIEIFSTSTFLTRLVDNLTGSLTAALQPSLEQLIAQEKTNETIKKINNSDPCLEEYKVSDNFYEFNNEELFEIEKNASQKLKGTTTVDLGCGVFESTIESATFKTVFDNVAKAPSNNANLVINEAITTVSLNLTSNVPNSDKNVATNSLNLKIIESIPLVLGNVIFEPKITSLYMIALKMVKGPLNNDTPNLNVKNSFDFSKAAKVFFEFVIRESLAALLEIIFNQLKKEILSLLIQTTTTIIKEQLKLKYKVLTGAILGTATNTLVGLVASKDIPNTSEFV